MMKSVGFVVEWETDQAVLWSCPIGKFWRFKSGQIRHQPNGDNLGEVAQEVASDINRDWVRVRICEQTEKGGARVTFEVALYGPHNILIKTKRVSRFVPIVWIEQINGKSAVARTRIAKKLSEATKMGTWVPVSGGLVSKDEVLSWLMKATASDVQKQRDKADRMAMEEASRTNSEIVLLLMSHLHREYLGCLKDFSNTKSAAKVGVTPDLADRDSSCALRLALGSESFRPWFEKWKERMAARAARLPKPKPVRIPDEVIPHCNVRWAEWSKQMVRTDYEESSCSARRFGKKWLISLPGGEEIVKMTGPNLVITPLS